MHIVLLNDDALPAAKGGAASVVDRLQKAYLREGHRVTLLTTHQDPAMGPVVKTDGVISLLSDYPLRERHRHCLGSPAMRAALVKAFAELKPDAVHAHNIHTHLTYESLLIAKRFTDHVVLTAHDVFLVAFARVRGERFERLAQQGIPLRMYFWEHLLSVGRKYWPLRNAAIRRILRESKVPVVAISEVHKRFLEVNGIHVRAVISNGVDVLPPVAAEEVRSFRQQWNLTGPTVLFGGRLTEDKGLSALLKAFVRVQRDVPDAQLLIVGDTARVADSLKGIGPLLDRAIVAPGWLSASQMRVAYSASSVVTTPSLCFDPFNLMNIEAMAEGKPVVATCTGGAPEIIVDGATGFTVNPRDTEAFASKLLLLLQDPQKAAQMGSAGCKRVQERFSVEKQCRGYLDLFAS